MLGYHKQNPTHNYVAVLFIIIAGIALTCSLLAYDILIKQYHVPAMEILFFRAVIGFFLLLPIFFKPFLQAPAQLKSASKFDWVKIILLAFFSGYWHLLTIRLQIHSSITQSGLVNFIPFVLLSFINLHLFKKNLKKFYSFPYIIVFLGISLLLFANRTTIPQIYIAVLSIISGTFVLVLIKNLSNQRYSISFITGVSSVGYFIPLIIPWHLFTQSPRNEILYFSLPILCIAVVAVGFNALFQVTYNRSIYHANSFPIISVFKVLPTLYIVMIDKFLFHTYFNYFLWPSIGLIVIGLIYVLMREEEIKLIHIFHIIKKLIHRV